MIEILSSGALNSVQDLGRYGYRDIGVGVSGAMDALAMEAANGLVGNAPSAAGLEITNFPFRMRFAFARPFALTGADCEAALDDQRIPPWWTLFAGGGQTLTLSAPARGARAYVSLRGGIRVPMVLGSRSTDIKARFGGFHGRGLTRGDRLRLATWKGPRVHSSVRPSGFGVVPPDVALPTTAHRVSDAMVVRVLPAAELEWFTRESRDRWWLTDWVVTPESNRMGFRLAGPRLEVHKPTELLSHGIVPGTIQVPPSGTPIVQLSESNTCGGYPKIAVVIPADLWRLAQTPLGGQVRFVLTDRETALAASQELRTYLDEIRRGRRRARARRCA